LVGLDHSREPVLDDTVASNWEADLSSILRAELARERD
jgi:hypothetical protein